MYLGHRKARLQYQQDGDIYPTEELQAPSINSQSVTVFPK